MCVVTDKSLAASDFSAEEIGQEHTKASEHAAKQEPPSWPEDGQGLTWLQKIYQRWTYSYLSPLLAKGSRQHHDGVRLVQEDLFVLPETMKSDRLSKQFREVFYGKGEQKLLRTLWHLIKFIYIPAGFCQLVTVLCQSTNPLIVRALLIVLEDNPSEQVIQEGLPLAIAIFLVLFTNGLANHRYRHLAMKSGVLMRNVLVNQIYEHVLHLTPKGRVGLTSGEVSTLVAVDTQKIFEAAQEGHLMWSLPLSICLVTVFLILIIGPVALVGIAVLISFLPLASFVTAQMLAIRQRRVKKTDERIGISTSMLQGIKIAKLNNYEASYLKKVSDAREAELKLLRKEMAVWAVTLTIMVVSPMLATVATLAVFVLISDDNVLTASKTFSTLLLFAALRFPINYAARFLGKAAQALSALERISLFMQRETQYSESEGVHHSTAKAEVAPLILEKAAFQQSQASPDPEPTESSSTGSTFKVSEFNFEVKRGEVLAVCGPVGCGKSTLIDGIISEVATASQETSVNLNGRVAYVPQTPFILNTTLRENILFGLPFDRDIYDRVLDCCCLRADIEQLGKARDLTQIGERGVTLSGGQKQRVSLARAAYSCPDLVLLDDPLSALDAGVSKLVFERLIKGNNAYYSNTAVVLVTHASHFLNLVDRILIIVGGSYQFLGNWAELASFHPADENTMTAVEHIKSSVQEDVNKNDEETDKTEGDQEKETDPRKTHEIMTVEQREYGLSSMKTWLLWFKHAGGLFFLSFLFVFLVFDRFLYVAVEYWIARWTSAAEEPIDVLGTEFPPQTDGRSAQYDYLKVLATIVALSIFATSLRSEWAVTGGSRAARKVFSRMLDRVLKAPMSYFETTPMGRILNRFTYDVEVVDIVLTEAMSILLIATSWYFAGVILMITILPWMVLALVPVTSVYMLILLHYRKSGVDLQRLDAVSRSPVQAMVTEVLDGSASIRVFERQQIFVERFRFAADANSAALLNYVTAQRWLGVRVESLGASIVLVSTTLVVCLNDVLRLEPGLVGLLIIWSANFTITLGFLIDFFGEAEAAITAIERVDEMTRIPIEKPMETDKYFLPPADWPSEGAIHFEKVCLRYRPGLPLALDNLTFSVPAGKTCGVVGRTGAGKSSLTVALFRLVEIESGGILLDGHDLGQLGLSDVRGRQNGMSIIPQDPFLTGSNLRDCIDPFRQNSDEDVLEALVSVRMATISDSIDRLDAPVEEGGSNFSVGERQLLNLARALLSQPKVLVLDEATASVDGETDAFIQRMLRTRFQQTTLLTIAHRLNTIIDFDFVLVMENGRAGEFGSPSDLLEKDGLFAELVDATGPESSKALRFAAMAS